MKSTLILPYPYFHQVCLASHDVINLGHYVNYLHPVVCLCPRSANLNKDSSDLFSTALPILASLSDGSKTDSDEQTKSGRL